MKTALQWHAEGKDFLTHRKFADAHRCFEEAIKLDPHLMDAYNEKYKMYFNDGKFDEVHQWCDKALKIKPKDDWSNFSKARAYNAQKKYAEALEWADKTIKLYPKWATVYNTKGNTLRYLGQRKEALEVFLKCVELNPNYLYPLRNISLIYDDEGKYEDALKYIEKAIKQAPKDAHYLIDKGNYLRKLGRKTEALEAYKKANKLYAEGSFNIDIVPTHMEWIKKMLGNLDDLEKAHAEAEATIKKADQSNPVVKKLIDHLVNLKKEKEKVIHNAVDKMGSHNDHGMFDEFQKLKNQYLEVQQQLDKVQSDVKGIKNDIQDVKEELANKMDDFNKKLDSELNKRDISPENQAKIKDYFNAFIGTFSSIYVTSQVIESGQVQLADKSKATVLSVIASFAPFVGGVLQSGIKTLSGFLQSKEMKTNARKMKRIAPDSTALSQILGSAAYEIVLHEQKQEQILTITSEDLMETSNDLFSKIAQFCENLKENIDVFLYSQLYISPASRLGHNDANKLVHAWIRDKVDPYEVSKSFVKKTVNMQKEDQIENEASEKPGNRSACCNMF